MLATETITTPGPLLGKAPMPLALRIRGTERGGQVVRLKSPKIAVGSSAKCALRLKAPGVAPLHCLILRGEQHTIVRRWNRDTRLNGGSFEDSPLFAGDRLAIGPIEFDVIEERAHGERRQRRDGEESTAAANTNQPVSPAAIEAALAPLTERLQLANMQGRRRTRGLLTKLRAATRKAEQLERRVAEGREQSREIEHRWSQWEHDRRALDDERQRWQEVHTQTETLLARRREQLDEQARRLAADRKSLAADLAALDADRLALDERYQALDTARSELETKRTAWQQQRTADETARTAKLAELAAREEELNRRVAEVATAKTRVEAMPVPPQVEPLASVCDTGTRLGEPRQPLAELAAETARLEETRQQLAAAREQLIAEQAAKTAEQNQRAAELAKQEQELAARGQMLDRQQAELESQRQSLAAAQEDLNRQRAELESRQQAETSHAEDADTALHARETELSQRAAQLEQHAADLQTRQTELDQTASAREAQWQQQCADLEARVGAVEQHQQELAATQTQLEHDRQQLETERSELTSQRQQLETDRAALAEEREQLHAKMQQRHSTIVPIVDLSHGDVPEANDEHLSTPTAEPEQAETIARDENTVAEKHDDDVFARLRAMSLLKSDDATDEGANVADGEETKAGAAIEPVASEKLEVAPTPRRAIQPTPPPQHAEGEDESIDDYMAALLQRMRGTPAEKTSTAAKPTSAPATLKVPAETAVQQPSAEPSVAENAAENEEPAKPAKLEKLEPRKAAPEKSVDLAAMRELANTSARAAIATHQKKRGWSKAWGKVGVGIVGLACGAAALWKAPSQDSPIFYGGIAGLVIATFWLAQAMFMAGRTKLPRREEAKPVGKPIDEKESAAGR